MYHSPSDGRNLLSAICTNFQVINCLLIVLIYNSLKIKKIFYFYVIFGPYSLFANCFTSVFFYI
jgi:hypothetical protein